jgi:molybdenum cofactor cytidylyltransferase
VIAAVVLAAGRATRFGSTKQLERHRGTPLVLHAVAAAREAGIDEVVVVVGHDAERVTAAVADQAPVVVNERYRQGISTSLVAGIDALGDDVEAAIVLLADQPAITAGHLRSLIAAMSSRPEPILRLVYADGRGPTLLRRGVWDQVRTLTGDAGARTLAEQRPDLVFEVTVAGAAPIDVDTREDLRRLDG